MTRILVSISRDQTPVGVWHKRSHLILISFSECHYDFGSADKLEIVLTLIIIARPTLWLWYSSLYCRTHNWALGLRVSANAAATATITARILEILVIGQNTRQGHPESLISRLLPSWCEITPSPSPSHYRATQQCHQR